MAEVSEATVFGPCAVSRGAGARGSAKGRASLALSAAALLLLTACQARVSVHGNMPEMEELASVQPGQDNRDSVLNRLGTPSSIATFQDNKWYYIGSKIKEEAYFRPEVIENQIMVVTFDDQGVVSKTEFLNLADAVEVDPQSRVTPTEGVEFTMMQQILGNFGRLPGAVGGKQTQ